MDTLRGVVLPGVGPPWRDPDGGPVRAVRLPHDPKPEGALEEVGDAAGEVVHDVPVLAHRPAHHRFVDERSPEQRRKRGEPIRPGSRDLDPRIAHGAVDRSPDPVPPNLDRRGTFVTVEVETWSTEPTFH